MNRDNSREFSGVYKRRKARQARIHKAIACPFVPILPIGTASRGPTDLQVSLRGSRASRGNRGNPAEILGIASSLRSSQ